jgi:hypothetical protein
MESVLQCTFNKKLRQGGVAMTNFERGYLRNGYRVGLIVYLFLWIGPIVFLNLPNTGCCIEKVFQISSTIGNEEFIQNTDGHSVFPLSDGYLVHSGLTDGRMNFTKFGLKGEFEFSKDFYSVSDGLRPYSAIKTKGGGYLVCGEFLNKPTGFLVQFDRDLNPLMAGEFSRYASALPVLIVRETSDGGYILGAGVAPGEIVIKLNQNFSVQWNTAISSIDHIYDIFETSDDFVIYGDGITGTSHLWFGGIRKEDGKSNNWFYNFVIPFPTDGIGRGSNMVQIGTNPLTLMLAHDYTLNAKIQKNAILLIPFIPGPDHPTTIVGKLLTGNGDAMLAGIEEDPTLSPTLGPTLMKLKDGNLLLGGWARWAGNSNTEARDLPFLAKIGSDNVFLWQNVYSYGGKNGGWFHGLSELPSGEILAVGGFGYDTAHFVSFTGDGTNEGSCFERVQTGFMLSDLTLEQPEILYFYYIYNPIAVIQQPEITKTAFTLIESEAQVVLECGQKPQNIVVTPTSEDFGCMAIGNTTNQTITVKNTGGEKLTIDKIGDPAPPFSRIASGTVKNDCIPGTILRPDQTCVILIQFAPTTPGSFTSTLRITSNDLDESVVDVKLYGNGGQPDITVAPNAVNFGAACAGSPLEQTVTVRNDGTCTLKLLSIGSASGPFSLVGGDCSKDKTLDPGGKCTILVRFNPSGVGSFASNFNISSTDPVDNQVTVTLAGSVGQPDITVAPNAVNFGTTCVGSPLEQTVTVRNDGTCTLKLLSIGSASGPFSLVGGDCSKDKTLDPGGKCTILVRFNPSGVGSFASSFNISSTDPVDNLVTVSLNGSGGEGDITVSPLNVDFGIVAEGRTSDKIITVTNDGTCPLSALTFNPDEPIGPFSVVPAGTTCQSGQSLKVNESCSIVVRFAPMAAGQFTSSLNILSDDRDEPTVTVRLKGGSGPDLVGDLISPLNKQCNTTWQGVQCTVRVAVSIMNIGTKDAPPSCLGIYLSSPGGFNRGSDPVLLETEVNGLRTGKSETRRFSVKLPAGETGVGRSLSVVNDCNSCIIEANKENNVKSYPIP